MGLHTTHDAWTGSYGSFNDFRRAIAKTIGMDLDKMHGFCKTPEACIRWETLAPLPIHEFLNHSDCDGDLKWDRCAAIADDLEHLLPYIEEDPIWPTHKAAAERFIAGLRLAHSKQEDLLFQ